MFTGIEQLLPLIMFRNQQEHWVELVLKLLRLVLMLTVMERTLLMEQHLFILQIVMVVQIQPMGQE
jgi:hypothetical protein